MNANEMLRFVKNSFDVKLLEYTKYHMSAVNYILHKLLKGGG